jgi:pimeloyl-ACP methyl ester carboxylesterase
MNARLLAATLFLVRCTAPAPPVESSADESHDRVSTTSDDPEEPRAAVDAGRAPEEHNGPEAGLYALRVEGFEPALVSVPEPRGTKEPVLVAVHGAGDGPEWECRAWREFLGERGVILCPAGKPLGGDYGGHFHPDHFALEKLVVASVAALESAFGDALADGPMVYAAYSQGATMGALMIVGHAVRFSRLILVEGGFSEWNVARGLEFRKGGGQRVLFACGTNHCRRKAERSVEWLQKAGLEARLETDVRAGHTYGGPVGVLLSRTFDWVVSGDDRWQ